MKNLEPGINEWDKLRLRHENFRVRASLTALKNNLNMKTFLKARWQDIVMVNYEVPKQLLIPFLPYDTVLDEFEGKNYVSLVGFQFTNSSIFGLPVPFFGSFDEVNLRFYVKRKLAKEERRGVVFINEIVPWRIVAFLANRLYKEHYSYAAMKSRIWRENDQKMLDYDWVNKSSHNFIKAAFSIAEDPIAEGSHEAFIYEHYYGYTKVNAAETWEYRVNHVRWQTNKIISYQVECDFENLYGRTFAFLNNQQPHSVYNAVGSSVSIDRRIEKLKR